MLALLLPPPPLHPMGVCQPHKASVSNSSPRDPIHSQLDALVRGRASTTAPIVYENASLFVSHCVYITSCFAVSCA